MHGDNNLPDRSIFTGDNLPIMEGINSGIVDLIYLDPPFNSNAVYGAPIGGKQTQAVFKDIWTLQDIDLSWWSDIRARNRSLYDYLAAVRGLHSASMMSYLIYMAVRLQEMHRILKPTGSIYLHCDPHASHYLKPLMDSVFGFRNFRNEIVWHYQTSSGKPQKHFIKNTDSLLFYAMSADSTFNELRIPWTRQTLKKWQTDEEGRIYRTNAGKRYYINPDGKLMDNVWRITLSSRSKERTGYPTQKPLDLLSRVIEASSNRGDLVLDPFCGCATTCVAAEYAGRLWTGIDIADKAAELVTDRLKSRLDTFQFAHFYDFPNRTDILDEDILPLNDETKVELHKKQCGYCFVCYDYFPISGMAIDHKIPRKHKGNNHRHNLQLLCTGCNSRKSSLPYAKAIARHIERVGYDLWEEKKAHAEREIHKQLNGNS